MTSKVHVGRAAYDDTYLTEAGDSADGIPRFVVGLTEEEIVEIYRLIRDEPVDEQLLSRIGARMRKKMKAIRGGLNPEPRVEL